LRNPATAFSEIDITVPRLEGERSVPTSVSEGPCGRGGARQPTEPVTQRMQSVAFCAAGSFGDQSEQVGEAA
jgi:hypothetical protein